MSPTLPYAERPYLPASYGITPSDDGLLPWSWAVDRLTGARNYWLATTRPNGQPHVAPIWGVWHEDTFYFGVGRESRKGLNIAQQPYVVVHLESGDEVVIVEGRVAEMTDTGQRELVGRLYGQKYDLAPALDAIDPNGLYLALRPEKAFGWLETEYPRTATRWRFG